MRIGDAEVVHVLLERQRRFGAQDAAERVVRLAERHVVPAQCRRAGRHHAGDAAADHEHLPLPRGGNDVEPLELAADARVERAATRLRDGTLGHAHEAAHAANDVVALVRHHLVRQLGIGEQRAAHHHEIGLAARDDLLHLIGIRQAADGGDGNRHVLLDLLGEVDVAAVLAEHRGVGDAETELVGAGRHVDDVDEVLERMRNAAALVEVVAAVEELGAAHAQLNREVRAHLGAHRGEDLASEAHAILERSAVLVGTVVEVG